MSRGFPDTIPIIGRVKVSLEIIKRYSLRAKTFVDVGCSFGWLEKELLNCGTYMIGIDPDVEAIKEAKKRLDKRSCFLVGDALSLPIRSNSVNFVAFLDVLEHLPKDSENIALHEIRIVLKKGGKLFLTTPNDHLLANLFDPAWYLGHRHYPKKQLTRLLKRNGFKILYHSVRGNLVGSIYTIWFYMTKIIFRKLHPRNHFLESLSNYSYNTKNGIIEHFVVAKKV